MHAIESFLIKKMIWKLFEEEKKSWDFAIHFLNIFLNGGMSFNFDWK